MNENQSFDDNLMEAARNLETEISPDRDLWPEIESAIATPSRTRWNSLFAQAAVVVLLVGASSGVTYLVVSNQDPGATPQFNGASLNIEQASFGDQYTLGPDYQDARASLKARLDVELEQMAPDARADVEKNLAAIRSVIEEINRALTLNPDNALLQELLLNTYQEELALMKKVDGVANAMNRTDF